MERGNKALHYRHGNVALLGYEHLVTTAACDPQPVPKIIFYKDGLTPYMQTLFSNIAKKPNGVLSPPLPLSFLICITYFIIVPGNLHRIL